MESYLDTLPVETLEDIIDYLSVKDINCLQKAYPIWKNSSFIHLKVLNLTREHGKIKQRRVPYINGCEPGMNYGEYIKYESKFYDACIAKEWKRLMEWEDVIDTVPYRVRQDGIFQKLRSVDHFQERQNLVLLAIEKKWVDPNRRYRRGEGEFGCCFTDKRDLSNMPLDTAAFNMYKQIVLVILNDPDFKFDQERYRNAIAACFHYGWKDVVELLVSKFSITVPEKSSFRTMGNRFFVYPQKLLRTWAEEV